MRNFVLHWVFVRLCSTAGRPEIKPDHRKSVLIMIILLYVWFGEKGKLEHPEKTSQSIVEDY